MMKIANQRHQKLMMPPATRLGQGNRLLSLRELKDQNRRFKGSGGVSQENREHGFLPAFQDSRTGAVYVSRFADGRVAPIHLLDGLPPELITKKTATGKVRAACDFVTAGFILEGRFYTREQAARACN